MTKYPPLTDFLAGDAVWDAILDWGRVPPDQGRAKEAHAVNDALRKAFRAYADATVALRTPTAERESSVPLSIGFSPMWFAPIDGTPVLLYMPTTGDKFAIGQWHGSPDSIQGNWGDDEGNFYVHEPTGWMGLHVLEKLAAAPSSQEKGGTAGTSGLLSIESSSPSASEETPDCPLCEDNDQVYKYMGRWRCGRCTGPSKEQSNG